ncbi:MAG: hypothetical protein CVV44_20155 [Spirochaetae bacterium HGW-Spirochaetae-1]|jgi:transcriptional regulator with XRE-family HTH domain|nr:MAG: hypothetical protein CVV44_20155 [Spirochaetae bacterium HGW-Spirochaetae-1]
MHWGEKLKSIREHFGLTQQQLADRLPGVSQRNISFWENSEYPPLDEIVKILRELNYTLNDFFGKPELKDEELMILEYYNRLNAKTRKAVMDFLRKLGE